MPMTMCLAFDNDKLGSNSESGNDHSPPHKLLVEMSTHSLSSSESSSSAAAEEIVSNSSSIASGDSSDDDDEALESLVTFGQQGECPSFTSNCGDEDATGAVTGPRSVTQSNDNYKKCVHFSDAEPEIITLVKPSSSMTPEERAQIHWQLQDYEYFRGTARIIASEILKLSTTKCPTVHSYDTVLTRVHQYCSCHHDNGCDWKEELVQDHLDFSQEQGKTLPLHHGKEEQSEEEQQHQEQQEEECTFSQQKRNAEHIPPNLFAALTHWIRAGHSRRGLEKFCIPHHMQTRPLERQSAVDAVLIAQDLLRKTRNESTVVPQDGMFHLGKWRFSLALPDEDILRILSERFSATGRKFATAMGHADAAAVGNYSAERTTNDICW